MSRKTLGFILLVLVAGVSTAVAQQSMDGPYVLHEYFTEIKETGAVAGAEPTPQAEATAGPGLPPSLSLEARPGEPIYAEDGPVYEEEIEEPYGPLSPFGGANTLDDRTDRVDSLTYYSNFDPSVIPYKRVVAQNQVLLKASGDYGVQLRSGERQPVELSTREDPTAELFWGTFLLRMEPNQVQPLASVAPDQKILQIETEPDVAVDLLKDRADNYYVRARTGGLVRLNLRIAAPAYYFNGEFQPVEWSDFPSGLVPPMDPALKSHAASLASSVGFDQTRSPEDVLLEMIRYFRDFDARPLPKRLRDRDRLNAIVKNQIGVCRHRSLAFVAIAQSLGIPTRYVYNEAHAFVEVYWPERGWRRVDLGGAADELNASATEGRTVHDPGSDDLPTPDRYLEEQERMARNGWNAPGLDGGQASDGATDDTDGSDPREDASGASGDEPTGEDPSGGTTESESASDDEPARPDDAVSAASEHLPPDGQDGADPDSSPETLPSPEFQEPPPDERIDTRLRIDEATAVVRRGGQLNLAARLSTADGKPLVDRPVSVYLGPVGMTDPGAAKRLGTIRTDHRGRVRARVEIPREHSIGRWSLFVVFSGDETHRPAIAD